MSHDVWFRWTAPSSGNYTVSTCGQTSVDTVLAVFASTTCPPTNALGCNNNACGLQSRLLINVTAGVDYLVEVGAGPTAAGGTGNLSIAATVGGCANPSTGPDVIVGDVSDISGYGQVGGVYAFALGTDSCKRRHPGAELDREHTEPPRDRSEHLPPERRALRAARAELAQARVHRAAAQPVLLVHLLGHGLAPRRRVLGPLRLGPERLAVGARPALGGQRHDGRVPLSVRLARPERERGLQAHPGERRGHQRRELPERHVLRRVPVRGPGRCRRGQWDEQRLVASDDPLGFWSQRHRHHAPHRARRDGVARGGPDGRPADRRHPGRRAPLGRQQLLRRRRRHLSLRVRRVQPEQPPQRR